VENGKLKTQNGTAFPEGIAFPLRGRWILPKAKDG